MMRHHDRYPGGDYAGCRGRRSPRRFHISVALFLALVPATANADMLIKLKDGRIIAVPVSPGEIESVTYGPPPKDASVEQVQPVQRAADQIKEDETAIKGARAAEERAEKAALAAEASAETARKAADSAKREAAAARVAREAAEKSSRAGPAASPPVASPPVASPPVASRPDAARPGALPPAAAVKRVAGTRQIIKVGPGEKYASPSAAAKAARDGDIVEIAAGLYAGDVAVWNAHNLTIRGVGGRAHMDSQGRAADGKAIWVITGNDYLIENIEFSNCRVPDLNGAGIRLEGRNLTVRNSYFHDNEMGILTGNNPTSDIVIEGSEFYRNVVDYPKTGRLGHNVYIGGVRSFTLRASYSHGAIWGHNVKSRAAENRILYNRLTDEKDGGASYIVDISDGGRAWLVGNVLEQGPKADNWVIVSFAAEKRADTDRLALVNNTIINNRSAGIFVQNRSPGPAILVNNIMAGPGSPLVGPGDLRANLVAKSVSAGLIESLVGGRGRATSGTGALGGNFTADVAGFADPKSFDFRLTKESPARDLGAEPGMIHQWPSRPVSQYAHPLRAPDRPRNGKLDIGAYEFPP